MSSSSLPPLRLLLAVGLLVAATACGADGNSVDGGDLADIGPGADAAADARPARDIGRTDDPTIGDAPERGDAPDDAVTEVRDDVADAEADTALDTADAPADAPTDTSDGGAEDSADTLPDTAPDGDRPAGCGDGVIGTGEACDDGNDDDTDACRNDCSLPFCGDGVVNATVGRVPFESPVVTDLFGNTGFVCDDGASCIQSTCEVFDRPLAPEHGICQSLGLDIALEVTWGNGPGTGIAPMPHASNWECYDYVCREGPFPSAAADCGSHEMLFSITCQGIVGEECDDGVGNGDGPGQCRPDCTLPFCGDGVADAPAEACDDGNDVDTDECTTFCGLARCGDAIIQPSNGEACDNGPGNRDLPDRCRTDCALPACGDGIVDTGEECDDGNAVADDGCSNVCRLPGCRDGVLDPGEECDDGNDVADDGCSNGCLLPQCGDAVLNGEETCDDGNDDDTDACRNSCRTATCGDGVLWVGVEACDEGLRNGDVPGAPCRSDCTLPRCGDGVVEGDEACDDGNRVDADGCSNSCRLPVCGDGIVQAEEACDDGNDIDTDACRLDCTEQVCGDGVLADAEDCDEGEANSNDPDALCRPDCRNPRCGDAITDTGERCDDGNDNDRDACTTRCEPARCGDGIRQVGLGEDCDDGNDVDDDACANDCTGDPTGVDCDTDFDIGTAVGAAVVTGNTASYGARYVTTCGASGRSPEASVSWSAPASGRYQIDLNGSSYDTVLHIRRADCVSQIACNDDGGTGAASLLVLNAEGGMEYLILVDGFGSTRTGDFVLNITPL